MSFPDGTAFRVDRGPVTNYQLDPNELYEYPSQDTVSVLKTCALNTEIRTVDVTGLAGDTYIFDTHINPRHFMSNDPKVYFSMPFVVNLRDDADAAITQANFVEKCFNKNSDIVYSQYSILQAIERFVIKLNDTDINAMNHMTEAFNMISPYYKSSDVDQYFHASQPDRYQSFDKYTAGTALADSSVNYINAMEEKVITTISAVNDSNIFASTTQNKYTTRTPEWSWEGTHPSGDAKKGCIVRCTFWTNIPLSIFTTSDNPTALGGVRRFGLEVNFKNDAASRLFNCKTFPGTGSQAAQRFTRYSSITLNTDGNNARGRLIVKILTPPQYMASEAIEKETNLLKPYVINFPLIKAQPWQDFTGIAPGESRQFTQANITAGSVPSSIYIGIAKKKKGNFQRMSTTPINFALLTKLTIKIDSAITTFNNIGALEHLSESNGYDELDPVGRLIRGFPIKIDCSKDLTFPGDTVVGAVGAFNMVVEGGFINQGETTEDYELQVAMIINGRLIYDGANFSIANGAVINSTALTETNFLKDHYSNHTRSMKVIGAGFFRNAGNFIKKAAVGAWNNRDNIAKVLGDVNKVRSLVMGGRLQASNVVGSGNNTPTLGAGEVKRSVFK